ncbi:PRK06851 family protein [Thermodesulfitimonas sp.]
MKQGKLRKMFPRGNTAAGFYSYYDQIIDPDARRIFIIKGGPGTGKSTFMRQIGEEMLARGFDVEFMCSSSANGSLDGVVIPAIRVALIDSTAPHGVNPKNPGVVDEIVHLGDFWDEAKLRAHKEEVLATNRRVNRLFGIAYAQLREAVIRDELESYIRESMDFARVNKVLRETARAIFKDAPVQHERFPQVRRLFASAISPDGVVHHLQTLLQDLKMLYVVQGPPGSGRSTFLARLAAAVIRGLDTEVFHCAFLPQEIDLFIIPVLKVAVLKEVPELGFVPPEQLTVQRVNLEEYSRLRRLAAYAAEIAYARRRFSEALGRAVHYLHSRRSLPMII